MEALTHAPDSKAMAVALRVMPWVVFAICVCIAFGVAYLMRQPY